MEAPKPQAGRKRPRGGPFRIRVGSVVALRQNRSSGGLWTPPDHTTDTGVLLIGKWIRCYLPDKQQVEGQVLKVPMSDAKETFQVDLLVQEALLKNLPDLSTVLDPPSSKNQQLEDQIRGPGRVVRLTLATPWYLSSRNTKRHRWAVLRSSTGGKYRGDGRDDETRQLINGRWVAARQDVQQQYKVTHMETQTTGSSSLATVGLQQVFLRGHQVRVGTEEKEVPIEQVILIARRIGETSEMGEDGIVNHLQLIEGPEETKFTSERVGPFENLEAFRQFAQARREFDFSSSFDGSASKKLLTKTPKLPTPKIEKKRKASATNGSAKKVKVKSEKNGVKRKTEKNGVHEKTPTANGEKRKIGRPKSPKRSTSPKPSGKRSTSPKPTKRNDIKNGVKSKPLPEDTIFQNTCARFVDYDKLRQWHYQRGNSLQVPPEKMRNLRDLPLYNPMPEADREEVPSGRAARASQRRMMKDVVSMGPMLSIDTLANRESQLRFDRSSIHAWGVFADKDIAAGEMVVEYRGELIGNSIAERREAEYEKAKIGSDYMFRMDGMQVCDATKQGNVARFINASCGPNCYTKIITLDGNKRIVIYAKRDIRAGEELCYDYKFPLEYDESKRIPCHCGTKECRGYMNWSHKAFEEENSGSSPEANQETDNDLEKKVRHRATAPFLHYRDGFHRQSGAKRIKRPPNSVTSAVSFYSKNGSRTQNREGTVSLDTKRRRSPNRFKSSVLLSNRKQELEEESRLLRNSFKSSPVDDRRASQEVVVEDVNEDEEDNDNIGDYREAEKRALDPASLVVSER